MADEEAIIDDHDLFCLTEIGNVALIIDASCVVSSTCTIPHATRDQCQLRAKAVHLPISLRKVALY